MTGAGPDGRHTVISSTAQQVASRRIARDQDGLLRAEQAWRIQHGVGHLSRFMMPDQRGGGALPPTQGHPNQLLAFAQHMRDHPSDTASRSPVDIASPAQVSSPSARIPPSRVVKRTTGPARAQAALRSARAIVARQGARQGAEDRMQWSAGSPSIFAAPSPASHTSPKPSPAAFSSTSPSPAQSEVVFAVSTPRLDEPQSEEQRAAEPIWLRVFREHVIASGAFGGILRAEVRVSPSVRR